MPIVFGLFRRAQHYAAAALAAMAFVGCGAPVGEGWTDFKTAQFFGAGKVTPNSDGSWTLWWPALAVSDGVTYDVFQVKAGEEFDFEKPQTNTPGNTFRTSDLRLVGNTCFVVRARQFGNSVDSNTNEVCTDHKPFVFEGLKELVSLKDGTYMLRWDAPPFSGAVFQILSRKKSEPEFLPLAMSDQSFYQTANIPLSESICFAVQHRIQDFPPDTNVKELCTSEEETGGFAGIEDITSPAQGALRVWWKPSTRSDVRQYRIYLGTTFRRSIAQLDAKDVCKMQEHKGENRTWCTFEQENLPHAAAYTYAVRAVDSFEREDDNRIVKSFELVNHPPVVASVTVTPNITSGRPESVTCSTEYSDSDAWQVLKPTFVFKNRSREMVGDVELVRRSLAAGTFESTYTLTPSDRRGDVLVCDVIVQDGFGGEHTRSSAPEFKPISTEGVGTSFLIPDTPVVATSISDVSATSQYPSFLYGIRNTMREVNISLGAGYTDFDSDAATSITITRVKNGNVCSVSDASCSVASVGPWMDGGEPREFQCQTDGTCKFQFVPKLDHFTDPTSPTTFQDSIAEVEYKININDFKVAGGVDSATSLLNASRGVFRINVRPTPRATAFYFKDGHQDETYLMSNDTQARILSGVARGFTSGLGWMGYESSLKITKMYTRLSLNASDQVSERPHGGFDFELMQSKGETVTCREQSFNLLESALVPTPSESAVTECEIQCRSPTPAEIDEIYQTRGKMSSAEIQRLKEDPFISICPFLFKPVAGYYGSAVFYYSVVDVNGLPSEYARGEINFVPSLRAIGHKMTVVEGEDARIEFTEQPEGSTAITGFDGTSEDVSVTGVNVRNSALFYGSDRTGPLGFVCDAGTVSCVAIAPSAMEGGLWPGYGKASYIYQMVGWDSRNLKSVTSNWCEPPTCETEVHYYPKPRATNPEYVVLESTSTGLSVMPGALTGGTGYHHPYGDNATVLSVKGYSQNRGSIAELGANPSLDLSCQGGACSFTVLANTNPCDGDWERCTMNLDYTVITKAALDSGLPPAKQDLESNVGRATIVVRPIPKPNDLAYIIPEGKKFQIVISKGVQAATNGLAGGYEYPLSGISAQSIQIVGAIPDGGSLSGGAFSCDNMACTAQYTPAANFTGPTSFEFRVTVYDPVMKSNVQSTEKGKISIVVRPTPKATGLSGPNKIIAVEGVLKPFEVKFGVAPDKVGYTYLGATKAEKAQTFPLDGIVLQNGNSKRMGDVLDLGGGERFFCSSADGACAASFSHAPLGDDWLGYGEGKFSYNVTVRDPDLGFLTSNNADAEVEVRPVPRAIGRQDLPNGPPVFVTVEDLPRSFSVRMGIGYTHPYNTKASKMLLVNTQNGVATGGNCTADGICSFEFTPSVQFFGDAVLTYKIQIPDNMVNFPPFNGVLESASTETKILIYPKPRATDVSAVGLQNKNKELTIEPNTVLNSNGGGYQHPYNDKAYCVKTENPRNGTVTSFNCNTAGKCTATFTPSAGYYSLNTDDRAGFDYYVFVKKDGVPLDTIGECPDGVTGLPLVKSNMGTVRINVRPMPVATGLTVVKKQGNSFAVELRAGAGAGYTDLASPPRIATAADFAGAASPSGAGTFTLWDCTTVSGVCSSTFTPEGVGDEAWFGDLTIPYTVSMFDTDVNVTITSDPAPLLVKVRPLPKGKDLSVAQKQAQDYQVALSTAPTSNPVYTHAYGYKAYRVEVRNILSGILRDSSNNEGFTCNTSNGLCVSIFKPNSSGEEFYWGNDAKFEYRLVVNDPVLAAVNGGDGDVEGLWKQVRIDYRPVPEPTGLISKVYLKEGDTKQVDLLWGAKSEKKGYAHGGPSFHLPANGVSVLPASGAIGNLSGFTCNSANDICSATYTAPTTGNTYGTSSFQYSVSVNDPILGVLESYTTNTFEVQIKPVPRTTGKTSKGVQNVAKTVVLSIGNGYFYPADYLYELSEPKILVDTFAPANGSISPFVCDPSTGNCSAIFTPTSDYTGLASFSYRVRVFDSNLGTLESNISNYSIDFYPTPKAIALLKSTNNHIVGKEATPKTFSFLSSKIGAQALPVFCNSQDALLNLPFGYLHPMCSPAVEILIDNDSFTNASIETPFACTGLGVCTGTVKPNPTGSGWYGYGLASFSYRVRINPAYLADETLSAAEIAALTSLPAQAQIEYSPIPKTKPLELWAVEDYEYSYVLDKCNDTQIEACEKGYTHGYNSPASMLMISNAQNLAKAGPFSCDVSGKCTGPIKPVSGYYSNQADPADRASLDFKVQVDSIDSNTSKLKFNVYPRPHAVERQAEGVQNEEFDIVYQLNQGYTHAQAGQAINLFLLGPEGGAFVQTSSCRSFDGTTCEKYECTAGVCVARFRAGTSAKPFAEFWGAAKVWFKVEIASPAGMPEVLKPGLVSEWASTEISILPKPIAGSAEVAIKENESRAFDLRSPAAYTHPMGEFATSILLPGSTLQGGVVPVLHNGTQKGALAQLQFLCTAGICANVFQPVANVYGPASIDFKVVVSNDSRLTSDNTGTINFDIRPVPDALNTPLVYEVEGTPYAFEIRQDQGFYHPYNEGMSTVPFPPRRILTNAVTNGALSTWDYSTDVNAAKNIFTPSSTWVPDRDNNKASFMFSVSVDDPKLGAINSDTTLRGKLEIEYRPFPRTQDLSFVGLENEDKTFTVSLGSGYTHAHDLKASDIEFQDFSNVALSSKNCNPSSGICTVGFAHQANFYGVATAKFRVKTVDSVLPVGKRDLWSGWSTVSIDFRPLPRPVNVVFKTKQDNLIAMKFGLQSAGDVRLAYAHPYNSEAGSNYLAKTLTLRNLSGGSVSGVGVTENAGVYSVPCNAQGVCAANFTPVAAFTGNVTFKFSVTVNEPLLSRDIVSPLGDGEVRVRPVPVGLSFSIAAAEVKPSEARTAPIEFGAAKSGFSYTAEPALPIHNVTVVNSDALNGTLSAFVCTAGVCRTEYQPTAGFKGNAQFSFLVWVNDPEMGPLPSPTPTTVTIDVRARPVVAEFTKYIAENSPFHPTEAATEVQISLDNAGNNGYRQVNNLKAFSISFPTTTNGTVSSAVCFESTGICTLNFTPTQGFSGGNATFTYSVKVHDPALGASEPGNVLESDLGTITLPVRARPVAQDMTFYAAQGTSKVIDVAKGNSVGYTHSLYSAIAAHVMTYDQGRLLSEPTFVCTSGTCTSTFVPKNLSVLGTAKVDYQVEISDVTLGRQLRSNTAALNLVYKGVPYVTGSPHTVATLINTSKEITFSKGNKYDYDDAANWDSVKASVKISISGATKGTFDGGVTSKDYFCNSVGLCAVNYTPNAGVYGTETLTYSVSVNDPNLGTLVSTSSGTVTVKIRPRPVANAVPAAYVHENIGQAANAQDYGRQYTFESGSQYAYAYVDAPAEFSNMRVVATGATKGKFFDGSSLVSSVTAACPSNICSVRYVPDSGMVDGATFSYKIVVFDSALQTDVESATATAGADIVPAPTCTNVDQAVMQFTTPMVSISKGSGWNHPRAAISPIEVLTFNSADGMPSGTGAAPFNGQLSGGNSVSLSCTSGLCTGTWMPSPTHFRSETSDTNAHKGIFVFKPAIKVDNALGFLASKDACLYRLTFQPYAVTSQKTNVPLVEGKTASYNIDLGDEYSHPWGLKATEVEVLYTNDLVGTVGTSGGVKAAGGAALDANQRTTCDALGACALELIPKPETSPEVSNKYGYSGASDTLTANFSFRVKVGGYWSTSNATSNSSTPSRVYVNKRPQPRPTGRTFVVRQGASIPSTSFFVANGQGYNVDTALTAANCQALTLINQTAAGGGWTTSKGAVSAPTLSSGKCTATYTASSSTWGQESLDYSISATDLVLNTAVNYTLPSLAGGSFTYSPINIDVRPLPIATGKVVFMAETADGFTSAQSISITKQVSTDTSGKSGYRHPLDAALPGTYLATAVSGSNVAYGTLGAASCSSGSCSILFTPASGRVGTDAASFDYTVTVVDNTLAPATYTYNTDSNVQSVPANVRVTIKERPRTSATEKVLKVVQGTTNVDVVLAKGATDQYTHPTLNANTVVVKSTSNLSVASQSCTSGTCTVRINPSSGSFYGDATFTYGVTVADPDLGVNLESPTPNSTARVQFRPLPVVSTAPAGIVTPQGTTVNVAFARDTNFSYPDIDNPVVVSNIKIYAYNAVGGTFGGQTSTRVSCTSTCTVAFTPNANVYSNSAFSDNVASFDYKVEIVDPVLNQTLTSSGTGNVKVNVRARPSLLTAIPSTGTIKVYEGLNSQQIHVTRVGSSITTEAINYPYYQDTGFRNSMVLIASGATAGTFGAGTASETASCSDTDALDCVITYNVPMGVKDAKSFQLTSRVTDSFLPVGSQSVDSSSATVNLDVYPRPVCNNVTVYGTQGSNTTVVIKPGTNLGYTHDRSHTATSAERVAGTATNGDVTSSTATCDANGFCTFTFAPSPTAFYTSQDGNTKSKFDFKVTVGGIASNTACTAEIISRPKPVAEPPTGLYAYEGQKQTLTLARSASQGGNAGYFHPYTDVRGQASSITTVSVAKGTLSGAFACVSGSCTSDFTPAMATASSDYGAGKASVSYSVTTGSAPNDVTSDQGTLSLHYRPIPKITDVTFKMIENTSATFQMGAGTNGYVYGISDYSPQTNPSQIEAVRTTGFDADPTFTCSGSSVCSATLQTSADFSRGAAGTARAEFKYRVKVTDPVSSAAVWSHGTTQSTWKVVSIDVAPRPRTSGFTLTTGREGVGLNINVARGSALGYTHIQGLNAKSINVSACTNCTYTSFNCSNPGGTGLCTATITPAGSFTSIAGEPAPPGEGSAFNHTGKPYGWARIQYSVTVNDTGYGGDITSPSGGDGYLWIYFRPVPTSNPYSVASPKTITDGIEQTQYSISVTNGAGWSYDRSDVRKPSSLSVLNVSGGTAQYVSCVTGTCSLTFDPPIVYPYFGTYTFDYHVRVTDQDSTMVSSADKSTAGPGRVSVKFRARPRVQNIGNAQLQTNVGYAGGYAIETCKENGTHDSGNLPTFVIDKATFNASNGSPTSTTGYYHWENMGPASVSVVSGTEQLGRVASNSCDGTSCTVRWEPRCWNDGEDTLTGQFQFKITDTQGLLSLGSAATASIQAVPRLKTTGRTYPKGDGTQGFSGVAKSVDIEPGAGKGYTHALTQYATKVKIVGGTGFSSPAINSEITSCSAGKCTFNIMPTVADANATLEYQVGDANGFISHAKGYLTVYFRSSPVATSVTQVVPQASTNNTLTISLGSGYTHPNMDQATGIVITNTSNLNLASGYVLNDSSFVCSSGVCTASYTPNPTYSSAEGVPATFSYRVKMGNDIVSANEGTYSIDVYPKPIVRDQDLYWVQSLGRWDDAVVSADRFNISLAKGSAPSAYSARGTDSATSIEGVGITTGSGAWTQGFSCSGGGTCVAKFQPSGTLASANPSTAAVVISYKARVTKGTVNIDSDAANVRIFIMPNPRTDNVALSVWEDSPTSFRFVTDVTGFSSPPVPVAAFATSWLSIWTHAAAISTNPPAPMTATAFNCSYAGGGCQTEVNPNGIVPANYEFQYTLTANAGGNWPKNVVSTASKATVTVNRILDAIDFQTPTASQFGQDVVTVQVQIRRGTEWQDYRSPTTGGLTSIQLDTTSDGATCSGRPERLTGSLGSFSSSDGGANWSASFVSAQGSYGYVCYTYRVKRDLGGGVVLYSPQKIMTIYVKPEDQPASVCNKTREGSKHTTGAYTGFYKYVSNPLSEVTGSVHGTRVLAYPSQARLVKAEKAYCSDDGWYIDPDNNATDKATHLIFTQLPTSGSITGCSAAPCSITCNSEGNCPFTYNPPATIGTASFKYKVNTRNAIMGVEKESPVADGIFQITNPPTPVAVNRSVTVIEDKGIPINISTASGTVQTFLQMDLQDGSDGYPFVVGDAQATSCDQGMNVTLPMDITCNLDGNCNLTIPTTYDSTATTTCNWRVRINGVYSNSATVTAAITPVDDPPQTYGDGVNQIAQLNNPDAHDSVHRLSYHEMCWGRSDWFATFKNRPTTVGVQGTIYSNYMYNWGDCRYEFGYLERDGDKAVEVQVDPASVLSTQIASLGSFTCDSAGRCRAALTPANNFVGTASFNYKVKTCYGGNTSLCTWQTSWSKYRLEVSERDTKPVSKSGSSVVGQGGIAPIVFTYEGHPSNWNGTTPPTTEGKYYKRTFRSTAHDNWWRTRHTKRVLTSNRTGASSSDFSCDWGTGVCVGMFNAAPGYVGAGGFDYQLRHSEGYTVYATHNTGWGSSYNYADELMIDSDTARWNVTVKGIPIPTGLNVITAINQQLVITLKRGAGLGYTHLENSPASLITVTNENLQGGSLSAFECDVNGDCTSTFTPANNYQGAASFEYFVTDSQTPNSYSSALGGTVNIQVAPAIILSDITRTGLTEGQTQALSIVRQAYPSTGALTGEGYAHKDNQAATTLTATGFSSGSLSGTGVSCASGTCTVNCASDGDSDANACSFNFVPSSGTYYGTATFNYKLTVAGTISDNKAVSLTYKARPTLKGTALAVTGIQGQNTTILIDYNAVTTGEYGYTHPTGGKASAVTLASLTNASQVGTPSCDANGLCTVVVKHATDGYGSASFTYNVTVDGLQATTARTVNLTYLEVPLAVAGKSATTDVNTVSTIVFNKGDEYTMASSAVASKIVTSNVQNGTTVDTDGSTAKSEFTCDGSGNCTIRFKPALGYAGNAGSFDFVVYNGVAASVGRTFSVKVDGAPSAQSRSLTGGQGGVARAITISLGNGYTDANNDVASTLETQNVANAAVSAFTCDASGVCSGTLTPQQTFTGNASFDFRVTTVDMTRTPNVSKTSGWSTVTLPTVAADEAPVATGRVISSASRSSQSVTIGLNTGYTDANSDKATALTLVSVDGATTTTPSCDSGTGNCTFTVTALSGTFGQAIVQYNVTTNGKTSNTAVLALNYSALASGCITNLSWSSLSLSDTCGLTLAATSTLNACSLSLQTGFIRNLGTGSVAANAGGMSTTITEFPSTERSFAASWQVTSDQDDVAVLQRALRMTTTAASDLRASPLASTPVRAQGMEGGQVPVAGCTGTCTIDNTVGQASLPTLAGGSLSAGSQFACATEGSGARCWGKNSSGQLGNGNNTDQSYAVAVNTSGLGGAGIVSVSAGLEFACGLLSTGEVACWGRNDKGQLGNATNTNSSTPVFVQRAGSTRLTNIVSLAAGDAHVCAVSGTKSVWCWGDGAFGALGVGSTAARNTAALVKSSGAAAAANFTNALAVSSKGQQSCVVQESGSDRKALCWGKNNLGQLGRGAQRSVTLDVGSVDFTTDQLTVSAHGLSTGDAVTLEGSTTLPTGITSATTVYYANVVDANTLQLFASSDAALSVDLTGVGSGVKLNRVFPFPAPIKSDASTDVATVAQISMQSGTTCVLLTNGGVRCVGDNSNGSTGYNASTGTTDYATAVKNSSNSADLTNVVSLGSGSNHVCALLNTGAVQCWGDNTSGQLGNSSTTDALLPVSVGSLNNAAGIAAGGSTSCALVRSVESGSVFGRVKCWGNNPSGMLGNGSVSTYSTSVGDAVKLDSSTFFGTRFRDCSTIYQVTDAP